jgi:AcrR family transcriptional regulator
MVSGPAGRPRDPSVDERVIESTLDAINEGGLAGLTIDDIAARAGVSKTTIYRRWDSKDALVVDAVASLSGVVGSVTTGGLRADLVTVARDLRQFFSDTSAGEVLPWLAGEIARRSDVGERYSVAVMVPKRALVSGIISRGIERGELRHDLDVSTAVDLIIGPVLARRLIGSLAESPESWPETLIDSLLTGWGVHPL